MTKRFCCGWMACLWIAGMGVSQAATLGVSPAQFAVHEVQPGRAYDIYQETGMRLSIYNEDDASRTYVLSTHRPSERGRWETGYSEIPDPAWCWFSENEITVAPKSAGYGYFFVQIPDEQKYLNQHWMTTVSVTGTSDTSNMSLGVDVRVAIETKSQASNEVAPDGELGLVPSTVTFSGVAPGASEEGSFLLWNTSGQEQVFLLNSLFSNARIEPKTYITAGRQRVPQLEWLQYPSTVTVPANSSAPIEVSLTLPLDAKTAGTWEDCLLITSERGTCGFVRIQIDAVGGEEPTER